MHMTSNKKVKLTRTAPRQMFLLPTPPTTNLPARLIQTPKQLFIRIINNSRKRAIGTRFQPFQPCRFKFGLLFEAFVQRDGLFR